jgi:multicomponent Na+:H+ antiporter subunit E
MTPDIDQDRGGPDAMPVTAATTLWRRRALAFAICLAAWVLLTGSLDLQELVAGVLVSLGVVAVSPARLHLLDGIVLSAAAPVSVLRYLGAFVMALVRANLDVARRVLSPSLPIRPAVVEISTGLESGLGRLILANSITLTPGTLTVEVDGERLLVHWIDCPPGTDPEAAARTIAGGFERHLRGFLR